MKNIIVFLLLSIPLGLFSQQGCTDPQATNYNSTSNYNNGSCTYNSSSISFTNSLTLPAQLNEISGMIYWNDKIYGHQDSGGATALYEVDPATASITRTITFTSISNVDWEDITQDDEYIYIGDFGNNANGNRQDLKIYKVAKSLLSGTADISVASSQIQTIYFSYQDQTDFTPQGANNTSFDCEAFAYNRGTLHLFTKNWIGTTTSHYTLTTAAGTQQAIKRDTYDTGSYKITGADFGAYDLLILIGYQTSGLANCALFLNYGFDGTYFYFNTGAKRRLDMGSAISYGQVEGICFKTLSLGGYISNEKFNPNSFVNVSQKIKSFDISSFIKDYYEHNQVIYSTTALPLSAGTIRYNNLTNKVEGYDGTHWNPFH